MSYVYRYTDLADGIIKYVGIVCRESDDESVLLRRFKEHANNDKWCAGKTWRIEYIKVPTRNDAFSLEGHFIAKYNTSNWYNTAKTDLGMLSFLNVDFEWTVLEDSIYVEPKELKEREVKRIYVEVDRFPDIVAERLAEVSECIRTIDDLLLKECYSRLEKDVLLNDRKELERQKNIFINYQLGYKLKLL